MIRPYCTTGWVLLAISLSGAAVGGELAGMVKTSSGQVTIERGSARIAAQVGTPIETEDKLRTGANGAVGVTLRDDTLLSAGPNSLIVIDKFSFDSKTQGGSMSIGVRKGKVSVATGRIAKQTPESVDFRTPTSVLGVRGTEFVVEVSEGSND